jgi:Zn-dependent peptidase ImmA (M78 family)
VFPRIGDDAIEANKPLKRPAVTWSSARVVRYRRDRTDVVRESLAHELGHCCSGEPSFGQFCVAHAWASPDPDERDAHHWAEEYLMPQHLVKPLIDLGGLMRLSELADRCRVTVPFARRRLRRAGLQQRVWDDYVVSRS